MARTTTDPTPHVVTTRLGDDDMDLLKRIARHWGGAWPYGVSRSEALRRLLREAGPKVLQRKHRKEG